MSCIKKIISLARNLVSGKNSKNCFLKLADIFDEECAYIQRIVVLEAIFNTTNDVKKLEEIGDIYAFKLKFEDGARKYYNKYLQASDNEFFTKYSNIADIETLNNTSLPRILQNKLDRYFVYVEIIRFLQERKFYREILDLKQGLKDIEEEIGSYLVQKEYSDLGPWNSLTDKKCYLSFILSNTDHHNDINRFAIELNSQNEAAYLNIIDDLVYYKNYEQALSMYNNEYVKAFPQEKPFTNIVDLCWFLSDRLYSIGQYFNAIERQKIAIDIELKNRECTNV